MRLYDETDPASIERHGRKLLQAGTLRGATGEKPIPARFLSRVLGAHDRGMFGRLLEENYYGIKPGSSKAPDFPKAGVELKSTPLLPGPKGLRKAKERLVLNIINYRTEAGATFATSSFMKKCADMMLVSYVHEAMRPAVDHPVEIAQLVAFKDLPEKDRLIIRDDWEKIHAKIRSGKAHELSEGDTLYLAACTKSADGSSRTIQANGIPAKPRAYSLKPSYMTALTRRILYPGMKELHEPVIRKTTTLKTRTLEQEVEDRFERFYGKPVGQIQRQIGKGLNTASKDHLANLARRMIGIKGKKIQEFEDAGIVMKTIQLTKNGRPKEAMSFPYFKAKELIKEKWDADPDGKIPRSALQEQLEKRFLFVVFKCDDQCKGGDCKVFDRAFFWTMPAKDLEKAEKVWKKAQAALKRNNPESLPKESDDVIIHVRPHGRNKKDTDVLPNGKKMTKRCFWLNHSYLLQITRG